jgi:hypothetical protein
MDNGTNLAFPQTYTYGKSTTIHFGLTKQEYIAIQLLTAVVAKDSVCTAHHYIPDVIKLTDVLLQELSKEK